MTPAEPVHYTIKQLPSSLRPRERLFAYGAGSLSNAELVAILLRTGSPAENAVELAQGLLAEFRSLGGLARAAVPELTKTNGVGPVKVAQILAALELGKRLQLEAPEERPQVRSPADAANLLIPVLSLLEQEELHIMLLDSKNHVLGTKQVCKGALNVTHVETGTLFRHAIRSNAAAVIVAHNHPSGDPTPSPDDVAITRQIVEAGKLLDVDVLDHLVVGGQRFISLKERGLGFCQ